MYKTKSVRKIVSERRNTFLATSIGLSIELVTDMQNEDQQAKSSNGRRRNGSYRLPLVGNVCRDAFCRVLGIDYRKLNNYKRHVKQWHFRPPVYALCNKAGNKQLKNGLADKVVAWILDVGNKVGESSAVRIHRTKAVDGIVSRYVSEVDVTFLPTTYTKEMVYWGFLEYFHEDDLQKRNKTIEDLKHDTSILNVCLSLRTFKRYWSHNEKCALVKVRRPTSDVCDDCWYFRNIIHGKRDQEDFDEMFQQHTEHVKKQLSLNMNTKSIETWRKRVQFHVFHSIMLKTSRYHTLHINQQSGTF